MGEATAVRTGQCRFGQGLEFGLNLVRACADDLSEVWVPTGRQASDLADELWPASRRAGAAVG